MNKLLTNWRTLLAIISLLAAIGSAVGTVKQGQDLEVGLSAVTGYRTSLASSIASTDATIPVASINDKAGNAIDASVLGNRIFFNLEPGTSREEVIMCTGRSGTSWNGCSRGLPFQGGILSLVSSSTLQKAHNAGATIVMSNVAQFYEELVDKTSTAIYDEFLGGTYVYTSSSPIFIGDGIAGRKCFFARTSNTTSTFPYICFSAGNRWNVSNDGASNFDITPTSTDAVSYGRGLLSTASVLDIATTTDRYPGLRFWTESGKERLAVATSTSAGGLAIVVDSEGLRFGASSTLFSGLAFNATSGVLELSGQIPYLNVGLGGYVSASSTSVTSTFRLLDVVEVMTIPKIQAAPTSTTATTTLVGDLYVNGSINGSGINYFGSSYIIGTFTRDLNAVDGAVAYTHNLGVVPKYVEIDCNGPTDGSGTLGGSHGRATSAGNEGSVNYNYIATNQCASANNTDIVVIDDDTACSGVGDENGNLTGLTSTDFTITWATTNNLTETIACTFMVSR